MDINYNRLSTNIKNEIPKSIKRFITDDLKNYIVIVDGQIVKKDLDSDFNEIYVEDFSNALKEKKDLLDKYQELNNQRNEATKYNYNEANSGLLIHVPKNLDLLNTIHVFYVSTQQELVNNTIIILDENSSFKYFEYFTSENEGKFNFVSNTIVNENSKLEYSGISRLNEKTIGVFNRNSYVKQYGQVEYSNAEMNDANTVVDSYISLDEENAVGTVKTVAITSRNQEAKFTEYVEHNAKFTEGYIENYGVSNDDSVLVFEGVGKICKGMSKSIARQSNKGIVLGATARLDANPLLLIDEYDVVASHGAAIGKIDDEQLYYLMSRGLTLKNAERLIISGFLSPVLKKLTTDILKEEFVLSVENKTL